MYEPQIVEADYFVFEGGQTLVGFYRGGNAVKRKGGERIAFISGVVSVQETYE